MDRLSYRVSFTSHISSITQSARPSTCPSAPFSREKKIEYYHFETHGFQMPLPKIQIMMNSAEDEVHADGLASKQPSMRTQRGGGDAK